MAVVLGAFCYGLSHDQCHKWSRCRSGLFAEYLNHFTELLLLPDAAGNISMCLGVRQTLVSISSEEEFALLTSSGARGRSVRYATWIRSLCLRTMSGAGRNSISLSASIRSMGFCSS